jgi:hypothetical protein
MQHEMLNMLLLPPNLDVIGKPQKSYFLVAGPLSGRGEGGKGNLEEKIQAASKLTNLTQGGGGRGSNMNRKCRNFFLSNLNSTTKKLFYMFPFHVRP